MNQEMQRELAFYPEIVFNLRVAGNNSETQTAQIKDLLQSGIDLLIVSPNEAEPLTEVVNEAYKTGIPVILIDRKTNSKEYTAYIGADNRQISETAVPKCIVKSLPSSSVCWAYIYFLFHCFIYVQN
jgi:ABC-type sugar transport system substrate-binding protein